MASKRRFNQATNSKPKTVNKDITVSAKQGDFIQSLANEVLFGGSAGGGKRIPVSTKILTPFGYKRNGDLKDGDLVINPRNGGICTILKAYPVQTEDVWLIRFDDDTQIECCKEHLWAYRCSGRAVKNYNRQRKMGTVDEWLGGYKLGTTEQIKAYVDRAIDQQKRGKRPNWVNIPVARASEFTVTTKNNETRYPLDPYLLGLLIGDGCTLDCVRLTTDDSEIADTIKHIAAKYGDVVKIEGIEITITGATIRNKLKELGLLGCHSYEKFIPEAYKIAPLSVRIPLMQGLMDTDGYVDNRGHMSYCTTSKQLADDVVWLARSLGAYAKITEKQSTYTHNGETREGRLAYNVWIKPHDPKMFVRLKRKLDRAIEQQTQPLRQIVSIEKLDYQQEMRCIQLDTMDGLYVATEDFIVTHNTYGQLIDSMIYANKYAGSNQLFLRETFPELERSAIMTSFELFPQEFATYNSSQHKWYWYNGSTIEFGYLDSDESVQKYQSAQYDIIRFDECSHFNEYRYMYMKSRLRGANDFPKQIKASTNPGGIGHKFLKKRFGIGVEEPGKPFKVYIGKDKFGKEYWETRCFIPSNVYDNRFLMERDPNYISNLLQMNERDRKALLEGDWEIFDDMAFPEFDRNIHVCEPFPIPKHWKRWVAVDNGYNDPFCWHFFAVDEFGHVYLYREYTRRHEDPKVLYTDQAIKVLEKSSHVEYDNGQETEYREKFQFIVAGLDAYATHVRDIQGKTLIDYYNEGGLYGFIKAVTDRRLRKATIHEYLKPYKDENLPVGQQMRAKISIFSTCKYVIEQLNEAILDEDDPEKYAEYADDHPLDSIGYGLIAFHAKKTRGLQQDKTEIQKHKDRLAKAFKTRRLA